MWPYQRRKAKISDCGWETINDERVFVHRFDPGKYTCRCKTCTIEKIVRKGGWLGYSKGHKK